MTTHSRSLRVSAGVHKSAMVTRSHLWPDRVRQRRDLSMMSGGWRRQGGGGGAGDEEEAKVEEAEEEESLVSRAER